MTDGWDASLLGPDPAPGRPAWTREQSRQLGNIADDAGRSLTSLRGIHSQLAGAAWEGAAADAFAQTVHDVVLSDLGKLHDSYGSAADALRRFADKVTSLQVEAAQLMARAKTAAANRDSANAGIQSQSGIQSSAEWDAGVAEAEVVGMVADVEWRIATSGADPGAIWSAGRHIGPVASHGTSEINSAVASVNLVLQGAHVSPATCGSVDGLIRSIGNTAQKRNDHQAAASAAAGRIKSYQQDLTAAQGELDGLRRQAKSLYDNEFHPATRSAHDALVGAGKQGLHNPSFFSHALHDLGQWAWDAGHFVYEEAKWMYDMQTFPLVALTDLLRYAGGDKGALDDLAKSAISLGKESVALFNQEMSIIKDIQPIVAILAFVPCLTPIMLPLAAGMSVAVAVDDALPLAGDAVDLAQGKSVPAGRWIGDGAQLGFDLVTSPLPDAKAGEAALRTLMNGNSSAIVTAGLAYTSPFMGYAYSYVAGEVPKLYEASKPLVDAALRAATEPTVVADRLLFDASYVME